MKSYKYYKQEGHIYTFKNQPVFTFILALFIFGIASMVYNSSSMLWAGIIFALGVLIVISYFSKKVIIDIAHKTITLKHSIFSPLRTFSFDDFQNFHITETKYMGFITMNCQLSAWFDFKGKDLQLTIGQTLTKRGIQNMLNETEDIMKVETSNR